MIMTVLASAMMINIKHNKSKIFYLIFGILISVIIYYLSFFFEELGKNEQMPLGVSIWIPLIIVMLIATFSLIRINENKIKKLTIIFFINLIFIPFGCSEEINFEANLID